MNSKKYSTEKKKKTCKRSIGGLRIEGLEPFLEDGIYKAACPEGCGYTMTETEIHECEDRCYVFGVEK